jgi:hypothetical protein
MNGRREGVERLTHLPRWARIVDYLSFALIVLAAYIAVFGGVSVELFDQRLKASSPLRILMEAAILSAVRHWRYREPTLREHVAIRFVWLQERAPWISPQRWPAAIVTAVSVGVTSRLAVLIVGYMAVNAVGYAIDTLPAWRASIDEWRNLPARWDSGWYLGIATHGYEWNPKYSGQQSLIFFPAFPMAMRAMAWATGSDLSDAAAVLWAGVLVSCLAFPVALAYLYALARDHIGESAAPMAVASLAAYPFAVFYSAAYTESLYLLAAVATFFHFTRGQFWWAAAWGLVTGLTRPNGWMATASLALIALPTLMPSLGLASLKEWLARWWPEYGNSVVTSTLTRQRRLFLLIAAGAPVVGLLLFSAYTYRLTGHPFTWARLMTYWGRDFNGLALVQHEVSQARFMGLLGYLGRDPLNALNAMALVFGIVSIWPVTRRLGLGYGLFVLVNIALPALSGGLESVGRYSSVLFPAFIWLGAVTPPALRPTVLVLLAIGQGFTTVLFFTWRAVY